MKTVLFVDDERMILDSFRRQYHDMRHDWEMLFANSALDALLIMSDRKVDVVVTDIRMPEMGGEELIQQIHQAYPKTIAIALSGQCSTSESVKIRKAGVKFLSKPCPPEKLAAYINGDLNSFYGDETE